MKKFGFTREILDDFQALLLLLFLVSAKSWMISVVKRTMVHAQQTQHKVGKVLELRGRRSTTCATHRVCGAARMLH